MSEPTANEKLGDLFASHYVEVLAYCARRIGRSDAEDAAAEVFAIASRRAGDIEWSSARPWLFGIARGVLANRWRSFHRWQKAVRTFGGLATPPMDGPDELVVRHAEDNSVLAVLQGLRQSDREVLMLAAWEELTGPEIAQSLGISVAAADQRLHRARERFATSYQRTMRPIGHADLPQKGVPDGN